MDSLVENVHIPLLEVANFYDFSIVNVRVKEKKKMRIIKNRREAARKINELDDEKKI